MPHKTARYGWEWQTPEEWEELERSHFEEQVVSELRPDLEENARLEQERKAAEEESRREIERFQLEAQAQMLEEQRRNEEQIARARQEELERQAEEAQGQAEEVRQFTEAVGRQLGAEVNEVNRFKALAGEQLQDEYEYAGFYTPSGEGRFEGLGEAVRAGRRLGGRPETGAMPGESPLSLIGDVLSTVEAPFRAGAKGLVKLEEMMPGVEVGPGRLTPLSLTPPGLAAGFIPKNIKEELYTLGLEAITPGIGFTKLPSLGRVAAGLKSALHGATEVKVTEAIGREPLPEAVPKLVEAIRSARPIRQQVELERIAERGRRAGALAGIQARQLGRGGLARQLATQRGELPAPARFEAVEALLEPRELDEIFNYVDRASWLRPFERLNTRIALESALVGKLPTQTQVTYIEKALGEQLAGAILSKRPLGQKGWEATIEGLNLLRTVKTIADHSFPGRQGIRLAPTYPGEWASSAYEGFKAIFNPKHAQVIDDLMRQDATPILVKGRGTMKFSDLAESAGLYRAPLERTAEAALREEEYVARWGRKIPGLGRLIKASERGFVTSGNLLRHDALKKKLWLETQKGAKAIDFDTVQSLANLFTRATGRGSLTAPALGLNAERLGPLLSGIQFAPRFRLSGPQWIFNLVNKDPVVRKEAAKQVVAYFGAGAAVLAALKAGEDNLGISIEVDPRSTDWGKIRVGKLRIEYWSGFQPLARSIVQLVSGEVKTARGDIIAIDRRNLQDNPAFRYFRSGMAPWFAEMAEVISGETMIGEPMRLDKQTILRELNNELLPIAWGDVVDSVREEGIRGGFLATLAPFGIGVQAYETQSEELARRFYERIGADYNPENPAHQMIVKEDPELSALRSSQTQKRESERQGISLQMENELGLPSLARKVLAGDSTAGEAFREQFSDYRQRVIGQIIESRFGSETNPRTPIGRIMQEYRGVVADKERYRDPVTNRIDYEAYGKAIDDVLTKLPAAERQAVESDIKSLDPDVQQAEAQLREARRLLDEVPPRWQGIDLKREMAIRRVQDRAAVLNRQLAARGQPDASVEAIYMIVGRDMGDLETARWAYALRPGSRLSKDLTRPEYNAFLIHNYKALGTLYPGLYTEDMLSFIGQRQRLGVR